MNILFKVLYDAWSSFSMVEVLALPVQLNFSFSFAVGTAFPEMLTNKIYSPGLQKNILPFCIIRRHIGWFGGNPNPIWTIWEWNMSPICGAQTLQFFFCKAMNNNSQNI